MAKPEFVPTEEQILAELKQKEQRKKYMQSDTAKANRKAYQQKRQESAKQMRDYLKANPGIEERMRAEHPEIFTA